MFVRGSVPTISQTPKLEDGFYQQNKPVYNIIRTLFATTIYKFYLQPTLLKEKTTCLGSSRCRKEYIFSMYARSTHVLSHARSRKRKKTTCIAYPGGIVKCEFHGFSIENCAIFNGKATDLLFHHNIVYSCVIHPPICMFTQKSEDWSSPKNPNWWIGWST